MPRIQDSRVLGVGDEIGAGDSYLVPDLLPAELAATVFDKLKSEVKWQLMYHRGMFLPVFYSHLTNRLDRWRGSEAGSGGG
jgi:hypothetical protein